jgi:two-component system, NtrC family, sensor histidine kinase HydH
MEFYAVLDRKRPTFGWFDVVWLLFLLGLAFLPPIDEIHKQLTLLAIGVLQIFEGRLIAWQPNRGRVYSVILKILLATLLIDHTSGAINGVYYPTIESSYYPVYYLPIVTAAIYFGPLGSLFWTAMSSLSYCYFLIPAIYIEDYELTREGATELAIRILFMFLAGVLVNRFAIENRRRTQQYQELSETLEETNRQLQRAEADARRSERLAALGQMSAGLAHEIRNPLGVIKGSAEMLGQKVKDSQPLVRELAGFIGTEVNRLNSLVARFLDFARPSHLDLRPARIPDIVDHAIESVHNQFPDANIKIERDYADNLPPVAVDAQLCEQVFINLVTNAYQAMDGQGGVLRVKIAPESSSGKAGVAVTLEDTGPGVPAELREQIFNPFFTSKKEGVGLGLSIVAKIVDDHRGWIKLEGKDSKGARFRVFLPESPNA